MKLMSSKRSITRSHAPASQCQCEKKCRSLFVVRQHPSTASLCIFRDRHRLPAKLLYHQVKAPYPLSSPLAPRSPPSKPLLSATSPKLGTHPLIHPLTLLHLPLLCPSSTTTTFSSASPYIKNCTPTLASMTKTPAAPRKNGMAAALHTPGSEPPAPAQPCSPQGPAEDQASGLVASARE